MDMQDVRALALPEEKKAWFVHDRFGMFVHWGLYALPARHEWVKNREEISDADYQPYFDHFNPDLYDPTQWARQARCGHVCWPDMVRDLRSLYPSVGR